MAGRVSVSFFSYDVPDGRDNDQEQEPGDRVGVVDPFDAVAAGVEPERPKDTEQADPDNPVHAVIFSGADILAGEGLA